MYVESNQVRGIRASCKIAAQVMTKLEKSIISGNTTLQVNEMAEKLMDAFQVRSAFLGYRGFPGCICISVNDEVLHGVPSKSRVISGGDIIKVDMGVVLNGYYSDMATTVLIDDGSEVSIENRKLMNANVSALMAGISAARPNNTTWHIASAIYDSLKSKGYEPVDDMCGHGVGLKLHQPPVVPNRTEGWDCTAILKPGMTIAIEPMVGIGTTKARIKNDGWTLVMENGKSASHFEHTVLITDGDPEILTL
jgi:methionyl aminopeptidase